MMNTDFRYQLESKRLTGHQPQKLSCPHCGKRKCLVRYVDTKNGNQYVADTVGKCDHPIDFTARPSKNSCEAFQKYPEGFLIFSAMQRRVSCMREEGRGKRDEG